MADRQRYTGSRQVNGERTRYTGTRAVQGERTRYTGGSTSSSTPAPKKNGGGGFLHALARYSGAEFAGNAAKDVGKTAVGVLPGIYHSGHAYYEQLSGKKPGAFTNEVVKPTIAQYKDTYGHGVGHFAHTFYKHPVGPVLDALTIADLGSTGAARLGLVKAGRAEVVTRSPRAIATGKGPRHVDITSTKPLVKLREVGAAKVRAHAPEGIGKGSIRIGGELKKYGKQIQADANQHALGHLNDYQPYLKATRHLSEREHAAMNIRAMDIHPNDLAQLWKGTPAEKLIADAKTRNLILNPSKRMIAAEPHARRLSLAGEKLFTRKGLLKDDTAAARPGLTKVQASERLGRPVKQIHGNPYYLPHTLEEQAKAGNPLKAAGGGKATPRKLGSTKQNMGVLALSGKLHLRSDVLGPEFLRRVKFVKYDEVHNGLVRGAVRVTHQEIEHFPGGKLPNGWEYVRAKPGQKIPATIRGASHERTPIEKLIPDANDPHDSQLAKDGFSTTDPAVAHQSGGRYYIVPSSTVKAATGEFTRSSDFTHNFIHKPLSVWRSLVLGLRPGFLTNNLVGNSVMYAVKTGGRGSIRDLFMAIKESHGDGVARKVLDSPATPPALRHSLYQEFFPEQMQGTFGKTQSPATSAVGAAANKTSAAFRATTGAIPKLTSAVAETGFRKGLIRHYIRHSPEFKKAYTALPKQTRSFEVAARNVLEGKGGAAYQRYVSKQVNQALGDYLNLSPLERNVLRNAVPFYSWYRAITVTTAHLAVDTPLRANVLGQLGQIGKQWSDSALGNVPSFLEGSIPLGNGANGTKRVLGTQGLNPYATFEQLRKGGTQDLSNLGLNPFIQGALDAYAKANQHGGSVGPGAIVGSTLKSMIENLPLARVAKPLPPSKLYPNRDRRSTLYGFLGAPVKEYDPSVAALQKRQGR